MYMTILKPFMNISINPLPFAHILPHVSGIMCGYMPYSYIFLRVQVDYVHSKFEKYTLAIESILLHPSGTILKRYIFTKTWKLKSM